MTRRIPPYETWRIRADLFSDVVVKFKTANTYPIYASPELSLFLSATFEQNCVF
jgi:hypothetical protein